MRRCFAQWLCLAAAGAQAFKDQHIFCGRPDSPVRYPKQHGRVPIQVDTQELSQRHFVSSITGNTPRCQWLQRLSLICNLGGKPDLRFVFADTVHR